MPEPPVSAFPSKMVLMSPAARRTRGSCKQRMETAQAYRAGRAKKHPEIWRAREEAASGE